MSSRCQERRIITVEEPVDRSAASSKPRSASSIDTSCVMSGLTSTPLAMSWRAGPGVTPSERLTPVAIGFAPTPLRAVGDLKYSRQRYRAESSDQIQRWYTTKDVRRASVSYRERAGALYSWVSQ